MYIHYTESQYLLKTRELRWVLEGDSGLSSEWGDKKSFSYIVAVDDSGSSFFSSITQNLTVD
jgi:hypothetical protein